MSAESLTRTNQAKVRGMQTRILLIAEEVQVAEGILSLSHDERWEAITKRLGARLERLLIELTSPDVSDRERAFLGGAVREIRLLLRTPDELRSGRKSIKAMSEAAEGLRRQIQEVKKNDQVWGEDPSL